MHSNCIIFAESDLPTLSLSTLDYQIITDHLRYCLLHRQLSSDLDVFCTRHQQQLEYTTSFPDSIPSSPAGVGV